MDFGLIVSDPTWPEFRITVDADPHLITVGPDPQHCKIESPALPGPQILPDYDPDPNCHFCVTEIGYVVLGCEVC